MTALQGVRKRIDQGFWGDFSNNRSGALTRFHQTHQFQAANRVAYGTAAYAKHFCKFAFGGKFVAGLQLLENQTFDLLGDLFVDFVSTDNFEVGFDSGGQRGSKWSDKWTSRPTEYTPVVKPPRKYFVAGMKKIDERPVEA